LTGVVATRLFFHNDIPESESEWIEPGSRLPGGLVAFYETPLWLPEQRTLVFADALTPRGELLAARHLTGIASTQGQPSTVTWQI
jgi:hypothetical protein